MAELSDLSRRNDELMTSKDSDLTVIRDLGAQLKEYKRKYELAKTELRSVKGIRSIFYLVFDHSLKPKGVSDVTIVSSSAKVG